MKIEPIAYVHERSVVFEPAFRDPNALRDIEGFSHLWLIWGEGLALTTVELAGLEKVRGKGTLLHIAGPGADDVPDGAPVFDIKPYIPYSDAHEENR